MSKFDQVYVYSICFMQIRNLRVIAKVNLNILVKHIQNDCPSTSNSEICMYLVSIYVTPAIV